MGGSQNLLFGVQRQSAKEFPSIAVGRASGECGLFFDHALPSARRETCLEPPRLGPSGRFLGMPRDLRHSGNDQTWPPPQDLGNFSNWAVSRTIGTIQPKHAENC